MAEKLLHEELQDLELLIELELEEQHLGLFSEWLLQEIKQNDWETQLWLLLLELQLVLLFLELTDEDEQL